MKKITKSYISVLMAVICLLQIFSVCGISYASDENSGQYEYYENSDIPAFDSVITHKNVSKKTSNKGREIVKNYTYRFSSDTEVETFKNDIESYEKLLEECGWENSSYSYSSLDEYVTRTYQNKFSVSFKLVPDIVPNCKVRKLSVSVKYPNLSRVHVYNSAGESAYVHAHNDFSPEVMSKIGWYNYPVVGIGNNHGRTLVIPKDNLAKYEQMGWKDIATKVNVYSENGNTKTVLASELQNHLQKGWYEYPVTTIYSQSGDKKIIPSSELEKWINMGWYDNSTPLVKMYSSDGSEFVLVPETEVKEWEDKGWINEYRKAIIYSPNGDVITISSYQLQSYKNVGWYDYPVTTVYAPDGRSHVVATTDVATWESVGWIDSRKTVAIYSPNGTSTTIPLYQLQSYKNVGWYDYPVTTVYAPDGRSHVVATTDVGTWENVGWIDGRKTVKIYSPNGSSTTIPLYQLQSYKNVGWFDYPVTTMYKGQQSIVIRKSEINFYISNGWSLEKPYTPSYSSPSYSSPSYSSPSYSSPSYSSPTKKEEPKYHYEYYYKDCTSCKGAGKRMCNICYGDGMKGYNRSCNYCNGNGYKMCIVCKGTGKSSIREKIKVYD